MALLRIFALYLMLVGVYAARWVPVMPIARPSILLDSGDMCGGVAWCVNRVGVVGMSICRNTTRPWSDVACKGVLTCTSLSTDNTVWGCIGPM